MKQQLKALCPHSVYKIYCRIKYWVQFHTCPTALAAEMFRGILGYEINWEHPKDINEKINWLKFYSDTSSWTRLADKYLAREYVSEKLGSDVLPALYGVWENASNIDITNLPNKFVLKTNHGCGGVVIVDDKESINAQKIKLEMSDALKHKFGYETVEPHYLKIKPVVIAEELIANNSGFSSSIPDYKVFCAGGEPTCILVCSDRTPEHVTLSFFDLDWNYMPEVVSGHHRDDYKLIPKPLCLGQMLEYAKILSKGFPQLRVDFYVSNNRLYVGELTFTSQGGYMDYLSREFSLKLGANIPLT